MDLSTIPSVIHTSSTAFSSRHMRRALCGAGYLFQQHNGFLLLRDGGRLAYNRRWHETLHKNMEGVLTRFRGANAVRLTTFASQPVTSKRDLSSCMASVTTVSAYRIFPLQFLSI